MIEAYPLHWPVGRPRARFRDRARFDVTLGRARDNVVHEVQLLCTRYREPGLVISSNLPVRRDGLPYANASQPGDPGVAVYFTYNDKQRCFACDRWNKVEDNLQAIAKSIEALRGLARWGSGDMLEAAFAGFAALPDLSRHWSDVLEVGRNATRAQIDAAYRSLAMSRHPDTGGSVEAMSELNQARDVALAEVAR